MADIEQAITPGGLARIKAPRIKEVLNLVLELNGSLDLSFLREMPLEEAKAWLRQLPGIGPKSAGIILSFSLGLPAMAIDTHIYRVCRRLALIGPKVTADKAHGILEAAVDPDQVFQFHLSFITHGRQVCKAQRPHCWDCVVASDCPSRDQFMTEEQDPVLEPGHRKWTSRFQSRSDETPSPFPAGGGGSAVKVGIINVTGYAGSELARILYQHPEVEITSVTGRSAAGKRLPRCCLTSGRWTSP